MPKSGSIMKPIDILVAGEINPDLISSGDLAPVFNQTEKLVDSAVLTIGHRPDLARRRLGLKVALIGVCGEDALVALCSLSCKSAAWTSPTSLSAWMDKLD
jgi:hypothetical protein